LREHDFLSIVAHELRSPITVIVGLAALLVDRRQTLTEEQVDGFLDRIHRQGERMDALVADLLDLAQFDAGRLRVTLAPVRLPGVVALALESAPAPTATSVAVAVPDDLWVVADACRLEQVLVNLLTNAYRYGGAAIRIAARRSDEHVLVTVCDDGEGVPAELITELFERYSRAATAAHRSGSGLGLAIVRALVEAFGGRVWYEPDRPVGARFSLLLPSAEPSDPLAAVTVERSKAIG
jgi:signal transduction histidine kinase